jgi:hypothetical protein
MEYVTICSRINRPLPIDMSFIKDESQRNEGGLHAVEEG